MAVDKVRKVLVCMYMFVCIVCVLIFLLIFSNVLPNCQALMANISCIVGQNLLLMFSRDNTFI